MTKDFFSVRINDPKLCSNIYAEARRGETVGDDIMKIYNCIPKKYVSEIDGKRPTNAEWRKYGILQRYLVPKMNTEVCPRGGERSLCPKVENGVKNESGIREISSIEERHGKIVSLKGGSKDEFTVKGR